MGEYSTYCLLDKLEGYKKFLFNCYIPKGDGTTTEVDVIMIHETGIYVIESKNYNGCIFGREDAYEWTQTLPRRYKTAKKFGYKRLGSVIETSIGNAIDIGVKNNVLEIVEGEKIVKK